MLIHNADITGSLLVNGTGYNTGSFSGSFIGEVAGTTATASYVEYNNVANKPALVSGSSQITYSDLTGIPSGIVSGSSQVSFNGITDKPTLVSGSEQVTYSGLTGIPSGIVSGSAQVAGFGIFATTGSNQFNGSQAITGSLTVTGQVVAQTLNVQQVTSSIVYSSGSNVFGNSLANTQQFTGSLQVSGSSHYLLGNVGIGVSPTTDKLEVGGGITIGTGVTANTDIRINNSTNEKTHYIFSDATTGDLGIESGVGVGIKFNTNQVNTKLYITSGGNVLIGSPPAEDNGARLQVSGNTSINGGALTALRLDANSGVAALNIGGTGTISVDAPGIEGGRFFLKDDGNIGIGTASPGNLLALEKSSNSGSGSTFPRIKVMNTLATQGDGTSTFNFADIMISAGNEAVNMFLATTYAAGTWAPAGIINVSTNHDLQFKTNNTTRLTLSNSGPATFSSSITAGGTSGGGTAIDSLIISNSNQGGGNLIIQNIYTTLGKIGIISEDVGSGTFNDGVFKVQLAADGTLQDRLTITSRGATTFSSSVTAASLLSTTWVGAQGVRISSAPSVQGVYLGNSGTTSGDFATIEMVGGTSGGSEIDFTTPSTDFIGRIGYSNSSNYMWFVTLSEERMRITSQGYVTKSFQPAFRAGRNASYNPGADSNIIFNSVFFNTGGHYNATTGLFTAPIAGIYYFSASVIWESVSDGQAMDDAFTIRVNGNVVAYDFRRGEYVAGTTGNNGYYSTSSNILLNLAANDNVSIRNFRSLTVHGNPNFSWFVGYLLG